MNEHPNQNEKFSYDEVSYPGLILSNTHPDRIAAIAKLYGLNPAPPEKCRVLELGCGDGTNLNWLAFNLSDSEFIGIDLAHNHIYEANKNADELQLQNIKFYQEDVLKITTDSFGTFDYIIAHGLFSWVPDFVREKILKIYDELLNPNGVGFISYNVYPGCYRRQMVNDMMRFFTRKFDAPNEKVEQGVAFINFINENAKSPVYKGLLEYELESMSSRPGQNIFHDDLAEINQPFYFSEFISKAENHNLKFLSETDYLFTHRTFLSEEATQTIENISQTAIEREQYSDFIESRRFRQTLLCKNSVETKESIDLSDLAELYVSSSLKPESPNIDLSQNSPMNFVNSKGEIIKVAHTLTKVVLAQLVSNGSHPIKFSELINNPLEILRSHNIIGENVDEEIEITATILLQLFSPNAINFHTVKSSAIDHVSEKPLVNNYTRWQLLRDDSVTNFYGNSLRIDNMFIKQLLNLLDGTKTRDDLLNELSSFINSNGEIPNKEEYLENLEETLDQNLFVLAKMGFLIA